MFYPVVLAVHIMTVVAAFFCAGISWVCRLIAAKAASPAEARLPATVAGLVGMAFPLLSLMLVVSGAALARGRWNWQTGWIVTGTAGLIVLNAVGFGILKPAGLRVKALMMADAPNGRFRQATREALNDPVAATGEWINHGVSVAVVIAMVVKPSLQAGLAMLAAAIIIPILYRFANVRLSGRVPSPEAEH